MAKKTNWTPWLVGTGIALLLLGGKKSAASGGDIAVSNELVTATTSPGAPAYNAIGYTATVTNPTSSPITDTFQFSYKFSTGTQWFNLGASSAQTITVPASGSGQLVLSPQKPSGGDWIDQGVGQIVSVRVTDSHGNVSAGA